MSHPCYCYPCSPCCTPCYPPCCTLCYVPYIVCCNPSCPAKPCRPASPPKKTPKLTDFSITGPSDGSKTNEIKKKGKDKDSKNVKDKEEKKSQSPKKSSAPKLVKNTGDGGRIKKDVGTKEKEGGGETDFAPQATVVKSDTGEKAKLENPKTTGAMGDIVKNKVAKTEEVTETREKEHPGTKEGAGDSAPPRKVICKCFAKQCRCTPKPTVCTPKPVVCTPQPMYKPNPVFGYTSQPGYKCTCKPFCQCVCKSKGATVFPSLQNNGRQLGAPHIYPGTGCTMLPYAGTPNLQSPQTAPSTRHKSRQPGTARVSGTGGYTFPFPGDGLFQGKVAPKRVPSPQGSTMPSYLGNKPAVAQVCSGKGYNKLPFAGDGLSPGNTYNRQPNVSVLPSQNNRWQPQTSQMYQGVPCVKPPVEYIRSICGTCGTIKYKPKDPVEPQKCQDCYFKGSFAIH